ncbi:hypothetical protein MYX75_06090 [Acidobacteria bacterium AH-259-A15]|nr:hypothetical protein [Acidobacteria bacterium AH-259-A15]
MRANRIVIAAVLISFFPAVALAQFNITSSSKRTIATGEKEVLGSITFSAGPSGTVEETGLEISGLPPIVTSDTIIADRIDDSDWTGEVTVASIDKAKGKFKLNIPAGTAGQTFKVQDIRVDVSAKSGAVSATITPEFNAITVDGLPANTVKVISEITTGATFTTAVEGAVLGLTGIVVEQAATIDIAEGFKDAFKSESQAGVGATNGVMVKLTPLNIPAKMDIVLSEVAGSTTLTGGIDLGEDGEGTASSLTIDDDTKFVIIKFTAPDKGDKETLKLEAKVKTPAPSALSVGSIEFKFSLWPASGVPQFATSETTVTAITILPGTTNLLLPFVSTVATFDTGIFISNTTADPFGTNGATAQSGTVTFHFFPNTGAASFSYTTMAGSPGDGLSATGEIGSGITYVVLARELLTAAGFAADFAGYVFAIADFTHAHAAGFISDFANFTQGTPALVLQPVQLDAGNRSKQAVEILDN